MRRPGIGVARRGGFRGIGARAPASAAPYTPPITEGMALWLDAFRSTRTESDGVIDALSDLSPSPIDATATGTARPVYQATGVGGAYPCITFDGIDDRMYVALGAKLLGKTAITVYMVVTDTTTSARYWLEYGANGGTSLAGSFALLANIGNTGSLSFYGRGNIGQNYWRSGVGSEDLATHKVICCSLDFAAAAGSEVQAIQSNGVALTGAQTGSSENTGALSSQTLCIGATNIGVSPVAGKLITLLVYDSLHDDAQKLEVARSLGDRCGLPFSDVMATRQAVSVLDMGQSNDMGEFESYSVIKGWHGPHTNPRVWAYKDVYQSPSWYNLAWSGNQADPGLGREAPDLVWAIDLARNHGLAPEVIKCARGSTSMAVDWEPTAGTAYARLVGTTLPTAESSHPDAPTDPIRVIVVIQGENDAISAAFAPNYGANFGACMTALQTERTEYAGCGFVIAQLHIDCRIGAATATTVGQVRTAQAAFVAEDPGRRELVDVDDIALQDDEVHWTEAGGITVALRISAAIARVVAFIQANP